MKPLKFTGSSLADLRKFPENAKREAGYQLNQVQLGFEPSDWKPMNSIGSGVREIRIHNDGEFRVIYITKLHETVYRGTAQEIVDQLTETSQKGEYTIILAPRNWII